MARTSFRAWFPGFWGVELIQTMQHPCGHFALPHGCPVAGSTLQSALRSFSTASLTSFFGCPSGTPVAWSYVLVFVNTSYRMLSLDS